MGFKKKKKKTQGIALQHFRTALKPLMQRPMKPIKLKCYNLVLHYRLKESCIKRKDLWDEGSILQS